MLNLIATGVDWVFPSVRAAKLFKHGINVTNSTNPLIFTKNITLIVVDCCTPPPVRLAEHCVAAGSLIVASVVSPNPVTIGSIGSAFHVITDIYDKC